MKEKQKDYLGILTRAEKIRRVPTTYRHTHITISKKEAQLPQRNSASAALVYLGWLTDRAMLRTPQNRRGCIIF